MEKKTGSEKDEKILIHNKPESGKTSFPVVGIGSSAGGLEVLKTLLEHLPADTGLAFVIIQHLAANQVSMLSEILSRSTSMQVHKIENGEKVEPNNVYVIPPDASITIVNDTLELNPLHHNLRPIDGFFASLASSRKTQAIGIVLSGTGTDGTEGLKAIKTEGGITIAQDPETAQYSGMPQSAIAAEVTYYVLSPEDIAKELVSISQHIQLVREEIKTKNGAQITAEDYYKEIFKLLKSASNVDFTHYKEATINRRIARRMVINHIDSTKDYVHFLQAHPNELKSLYNDLLIGVTSFFREPNTFDVLKEKVFPEILRTKSPDNIIRVWVPGCSTGEEVYSLVIALREFLESKNLAQQPVQVFATDINERNIEKARQAVYSVTIEEHVPERILRKYFERSNGNYQVVKFIREMCVFARQDITKDPPFSNLDMVCCRNVLIYLDSYLQERVIPILNYALKPEGYLVLGESESIGKFTDLFKPIEKKSPVFIKKKTTEQINLGFELFQIPALKGPSFQFAKKDRMAALREEVDKVIALKYAPPMLLVNSNFDIIIFSGNVSPYINPESGEASLNLSKMLREEIKIEAQAGIYRVKKENKPVTSENISFKTNHITKTVSLDILPVTPKNSDEKFYLILIKEPSASTTNVLPIPEKLTRDKQMLELREELDSTKQSLQTIIEEEEATNEELRAAMEEVQSSNEELQSTNEEMETAREELQSSNEELKTLNDELKIRNSDLARSNDDLSNLIKNMAMPLIMVDYELKIRKFTPLAQDALGLIPSDIGRSITNIRLNIPVKNLEQKILEVMTKLQATKTEVIDQNGKWYELHIRPYVTEGKKIDGAVVSFIDVDDIKQAQNRIQRDAEKYKALAENSPDIIVRFDKDLRLIYIQSFSG